MRIQYKRRSHCKLKRLLQKPQNDDFCSVNTVDKTFSLRLFNVKVCKNISHRICIFLKTSVITHPPPKFAKVLFSQVSGCLSVHKGVSVSDPRGCLPHLPRGRHPPGQTPPGQTPPWADTPWADTPLGRHPPGQTPPRQTPPGIHLQADTPLGRHPHYPVHGGIHPLCPVHGGIQPPAQCMVGYTPSAQCMVGYSPPPSACWDTVNKRVVRIPLECILVHSFFFNVNKSNSKLPEVV